MAEVSTAHIRRMLNQAERLAREAPEAHRHDPPAQIRSLERAANLARHAAAELEDEMLRLRDDWPVV